MNEKMSSVELRVLTGLGKGSLENQQEKLDAAGFVRTRNVKSFGGMHQTVTITEKGLESCRTLLRRIQSLGVDSRNGCRERIPKSLLFLERAMREIKETGFCYRLSRRGLEPLVLLKFRYLALQSHGLVPEVGINEEQAD
jgi:hypothetical protein